MTPRARYPGPTCEWCCVFITRACVCLCQLGDAGALGASPTPVLVGGIPRASPIITSGLRFVCVGSVAGELYCWGSDHSDEVKLCPPCPSTGPGIGTLREPLCVCVCVSQLGVANSGSQATDDLPPTLASALAAANVTALGAGDAFTCAVNGSDSLLCWGDNGYMQLGEESDTVVSTAGPVVVPLAGVSSIALGFGHACAIVKGAHTRRVVVVCL